MKGNPLKQYDFFSIESNLDLENVVDRIKQHVNLESKIGFFDSNSKSNKKFYGIFNSPDKFLIMNNNNMIEGITGKNETEIIISKNNDKTQLDFSVKNIGTKLLLIIMALPFLGLLGYFIYDPKFDLDIKSGLLILSLPILILVFGILIIRKNLDWKKTFFENILK